MFPLRLDLDAPAELDEHLHEVAFDLWARWHLEPEYARSIVESFVAEEDLHGPYNWLHAHELASYWAGHLYHRHVHGCDDLFVLDREIVTGSRYAVYGRLDPAPLAGDPNEQAVGEFFAALLDPQTTEPIGERTGTATIPSAFVLDIGLIESPDTGARQWAVVEANMAWFAHCYAADPDRVLDVVLRSAGPLRRVAVGDFEYLRPVGATTLGSVSS